MIVTMAPHVWLCLVTLVLCCWYADETLGAGLKVSLTQLGLNYAAKVGCGFIHKKLNGLRLMNQSGKKIFEYSVKNMKVGVADWPRQMAVVVVVVIIIIISASSKLVILKKWSMQPSC